MDSYNRTGDTSEPEIPKVPETEALQRNAILKSMLANISSYEKDYPKVKVDVLKNDVLENVLQAPRTDNDVDFDPEMQLRGFLRTFEDLPAYAEQFKVLDPRTKQQISTFKDDEKGWRDTEIWKDTTKKGFLLPEINPDVSHMFVTSPTTSSLSPLSNATNWFLDAFVCIAKPIALCLAKLRLDRAVAQLKWAQWTRYRGGPKIYEDDGNTKIVDVYSNMPFENWGKSINNEPKYTFVPTTVMGVKRIVKYAKKKNLRVRCSGYRHSWSNTFSQKAEVLISLLPIAQVNTLPDPISIVPTSTTGMTELSTIELIEKGPSIPLNKSWCRMGVAVTNEDFRRWAVENKKWALPVDVILVEVTIGGVNAPICHGAGARHMTVSDYVRCVEYVDVNGELRSVSKPEHLKAAAGCFGLLGVVTHITFELDYFEQMTYAELRPLKQPVAEAVPPIDKNAIPLALRTKPQTAGKGRKAIKGWDEITEKDLEDWKDSFAEKAANDYYSEWFWFTYQHRVWVNCWNTTTDAEGLEEYPTAVDTFLQWLQGWLGGVISETYFFQALPGAWQTQMLATLGMAVLPPVLQEDNEPSYKTMIPDALHFRRGIQNMRVRDMEFQIPIPNLPGSEKPDFEIVQRAWWDVINLVYELANKKPRSFLEGFKNFFSRAQREARTPMRLTLELRIMKGSDMHMAPQAGNNLTASIEILTIPDASHDGEWNDFMQRVSDKWMSYMDKNTGKVLNARPHWAKEWETLKMGPKKLAARQYLHDNSYKDAIVDFRKTLTDIGREQGWGLKELQARFSNELWDKMIYS